MQPEKVDAGWAKKPVPSQAQTPESESTERVSTERRKPKLQKNPVIVKNEDECNPSLRSGR